MKNFILHNMAALSNDKPVICTNVNPIRDYVDGHYLDEIKGYKYDCVFVGNGYEKMPIKTEEVNSAITQNLIEENGGEIEVTVDGFCCTIFADKKSGELWLSAKALCVRPLVRGGDDDVRIF